MTNKNTIKKLLAAASTVAILASGSSALARDAHLLVDPGDVATGGNFTQVLGADVPLVNGDNLIYDVAGTINANNAALALGTVNVNGKAAILSVTNNLSVADLTASAAGGSSLTVNMNGGNLTLTGTSYNTAAASIGALVNGASVADNLVVDFQNTASTVKFNAAGANFTGTFQNTGAGAGNNGAVQISENTTFTNAAMGAANPAKVTFTVDTAKTLTLDGATDLSTAGLTTVDGTGGLIINGTAKTGDVKISADNGHVDVNSTAAAAANNVTFHSAGGILNLTQGTVTTVTANGANQGIVNVLGNSTVNQLGAGNAVASVNFTKAATLTLGAGGEHKANTVTSAAGVAGVIVIGNQDVTIGTATVADNTASNTFNFTAVNRTLNITGVSFTGNVNGATAAGNGGAIATRGNVNISNTLTTASGTLSGLDKVTLSGGKSATFGSGLNLVGVGTLELAGGSTATISALGAPTVENKNLAITTTVTDADSVVFTNAADNTISVSQLGTVVGPFALKSVTLGAGNVTVVPANVGTGATGDANITKLVFGADATATTTLTVNNLANVGGAANSITTTVAGTGNIAWAGSGVAAGNTTLQADLGTAALSLNSLAYTGTVTQTLHLNSKNTFGSSVTSTGKADVLTVDQVGSAAAATTYGQFGSQTNRLLSLAFNNVAANTATVNGTIYAKGVTMGTGTFALSSIDGVDSTATGVSFSAANGTTTFADGAVLSNAALTTAATNANANVTFAGDATVGKIGEAGKLLGTITFTGGAGKAATLNGDIYATALNFGEGSYTPSTDVTVTGPVTLTAAATLNVGAQDTTLTFADAITNDAAALTVQFSSDVDGVYGAVSGTTVSKVANLNATINPLASYAKDGTVVTNVITLTGTDLSSFNHKLIGSNNLMDWKLVQGSDQYHLDIQATQDVARLATAVAKAGGNSKSQALVNRLEGSTGNAEKFLEVLGNSSSEIAAEASNRMTAEASTAGHVTAATSDNQDTFAQRLNIVSSATGVSSGSESSMMNLGVWAQVNGAKTTQKAKKLDSGFTANGNGLTVGVDTKLADMTTIGIAATQSSSTLKFKNTKSGDKAKSTSTFFNLYARHELANDWFVQGIAGFGQGSIKATDKRVATAQTYDTATAKYDTMSYSLDVTTGYTYKVAETTALVPTVGLRYISVNEGGYTETGSAFNRTVTKKASDVLSGVFGGYVKQDVDMSGTTALVEAHAFGNYDFTNKNAKVSAKLDGLSGTFDISPSKQNKFSYNLGVSANARMEMVEYGIGYDAKLADKFVSHQGTLRLRVDL